MASRDDLLDAALTALNTHPTATLAEIATAIGVSRATLHRRFASRDALVEEMATRSLDRWEATHAAVDLAGAAESGDAARIDAALRSMLRAYVTDAHDFGFALTDEVSLALPALAERCDEILQREVAFYAAAQRAGVLREDVPAVWIGHLVFGAMVAARDALRFGTVARRDLEDLVESTVLNGVAR